MTQRILVVPTAPIAASVIRARLAEIVEGDVEIEIVAPASEIGRLDWLTNAEDDARADAAVRAVGVAEAMPGNSAVALVGDTSPVQAIEDALRAWPADRVIVVTRPDEDAGWLESGAGKAAQERFAVPVTHLTIAE